MRIAFIGGRGVIGEYSGIETYYEAVGSELAASGHDVVVYCRSYFTPPTSSYNGMRIVRLPTIRSKHLETFVHSLLASVHALAAGYDVVHYHAIGSSLFAPLMRLRGTRTVVSVQGLDWQRAKWGVLAKTFLRWCEWASARLPDTTIVVSECLKDRYWERYRIMPHCIPNGVGTSQHRSARRILDWGLTPRQYVLYVGRLSPEKNCHLLLDAYRKLGTPMKLVLAGGSSHSDAYVRQLKAYESDHVVFPGFIRGEPLEELLSNAALFVLPSSIEGLSIALLEAMSYGNCVLVSNIPENLEAIEGAGFSFAAGDVDDLTAQMAMLLSDSALRECAGRRAVERVALNYQWKSVATQTESVYRGLVGGG